MSEKREFSADKVIFTDDGVANVVMIATPGPQSLVFPGLLEINLSTGEVIGPLENAGEAGKRFIDSVREHLADLFAERDVARSIVRDIHWMAVRYADGRKTYAVGMLNDALKKAYDAGWLEFREDPGHTPQYARDGMSPEWQSLEKRLADALAGETPPPVEDGKLF